MNPILKRLKEWNDVFPEHLGLLAIRLCDDGSGHIESWNHETIFSFPSIAHFFAVEPQKVKDGIR